jgi:hypothetical protein
MDCFTGFYAGFAIFTVLGHMYNLKCVDSFKDVVSGGPELAFIVYPEGRLSIFLLFRKLNNFFSSCFKV